LKPKAWNSLDLIDRLPIPEEESLRFASDGVLCTNGEDGDEG
jgi:hypothetical protein